MRILHKNNACFLIPIWYKNYMTDKLSEYLENNGLTQSEFASLIGVKQATVSRYLAGESIPEPEIMSKIFKKTKGEITPNDFYGVE